MPTSTKFTSGEVVWLPPPSHAVSQPALNNGRVLFPIDPQGFSEYGRGYPRLASAGLTVA